MTAFGEITISGVFGYGPRNQGVFILNEAGHRDSRRVQGPAACTEHPPPCDRVQLVPLMFPSCGGDPVRLFHQDSWSYYGLKVVDPICLRRQNQRDRVQGDLLLFITWGARPIWAVHRLFVMR